MSEEIKQIPLSDIKPEINTDRIVDEIQEHEAFFKKVGRWKVPEYANIFFDGLYSEYRAMAAEHVDEEVKKNLAALAPRLEEIRQKRLQGELSWNDVYEFDLALLAMMPAKDLVRKAYDMRAKYRSIAGPKDYDAYIASKPPDLTAVDSHAQDDSPEAPVVTVEALRADTRYLLKQFYLHYAFLPYREGFRDELTRRARNATFVILGIAVILTVFEYLISQISHKYNIELNYGSVVLVVIFAGVIGGCVSMLQRIQSAPGEGDALYNLAALSHGWKGISLSPLYGGIFATLLFILFSAGILKGTIFPVITTTFRSLPAAESKKSNEGAQTNSNTNVSSETIANQAAINSNNSNSNQSASPSPAQAVAAASPTPTASASPSPSPQASASADISFKGFLQGTYPDSGVSYALLVVWSFIAGFAERLVPDTLNRLVTKNESIQGTGA
jgi:hypothetical protein